MRIAMTGNPNSGKTTMYNALTGRSEHVGNWTGVTVSEKEHAVKKKYVPDGLTVIAVDLPGTYSISPFTSEESITGDYVRSGHPDVIINIVDATNLSRSLFFTTQLLELGVPVVVALNKSDLNAKNDTTIDEKLLAKKLHCPVIKTASTSGEGLSELMETAIAHAGSKQTAPFVPAPFDPGNKQAAEAADRTRFDFINDLVSAVEVRKISSGKPNTFDAIDRFLTHPLLGIPIFACVVWLVFFLSQSTVGTWLADILTGRIEVFQEWVAGLVKNASPFLQAILVDGIIGGVGAVVGFLPLVMVMYFLIALLEDCGYMARATVVLDPIFKKAGLSGRSVIPMVLGTGCGVPAIMACRTIKNERERRATAMLCTFMPCGAKLPVIALFAGAFFPGSKWIGPVMYFVGIFMILIGALLIKQITGAQYKKSYFLIELPSYKVPSLKLAVLSMLERGKAYIVKAGTIILVCNTIVQIMASFTPTLAAAAENGSDSILAMVAAPFATLLIPIIGFASWQCAAAAITGFIAKENVVGTLATVFCITNFIDTEELALIGGGNEVAAIMGLTKAAALAYLMFNLFTPPCFAALGAMRAEMKSGKWLAGAVAFQLSVGFLIGFLVYQTDTLLTSGHVGAGFVGGLVAVSCIVAVIAVLCVRGSRKDTGIAK